MPIPHACVARCGSCVKSLAKGDKTGAELVFRQTVSALDKAVQKGVIHENTASRYKSRLSARVNALK